MGVRDSETLSVDAIKSCASSKSCSNKPTTNAWPAGMDPSGAKNIPSTLVLSIFRNFTVWSQFKIQNDPIAIIVKFQRTFFWTSCISTSEKPQARPAKMLNCRRSSTSSFCIGFLQFRYESSDHQMGFLRNTHKSGDTSRKLANNVFNVSSEYGD